MELTKESIETFHSEARVLMDLQHDSIVSCYGITLLPPAFGVVMEFCKNGSLYSYLYEKDQPKKRSNRKKKQLSVARDASPLFDNSAMLQFPSERSLRVASGERKVSVDFEMRMTNSSLMSVNTISGLIDSSVCFKMMLSAASGLAFFHSKRYCHCDMKSLNYLVTDVRLILK